MAERSMLVCACCGNIQAEKTASTNECEYCGNKTAKTQYTYSDWLKLSECGEPADSDKVLDWEDSVREEYTLNAPEFNRVLWNKRANEQLAHSDAARSTRCPYCHSTLIEPISSTNKLVSYAIFGILSFFNLSKTYRCLDCGYKW